VINAYESKVTIKTNAISELFNGYWSNDVWNIKDTFFDDLRPVKLGISNKTIDFSAFSAPIRAEVKYMYAHKLEAREIRLSTVLAYRAAINQFAEFLNIYYPEIISIANIPYDKAILQWRSFLIDKSISINDDGKISTPNYEVIFNQTYSYFTNFYDSRDEYEKDVWDCRKIPGAKITETTSNYYLNFTDVPLAFRDIVRRYIKFRLTNNSQGQCRSDIMALRLFTKHVYIKEPLWQDLKLLTRRHIEDYLSWYREYTNKWKTQYVRGLINLRIFLDYIQRAMYIEAPELPSACLIFKEDIPRIPQKTEEDIKYIPEGVLQQLEDNWKYLTPSEYIPILVLLRASGWRISDILNLRYNNCLDRTSQGWYLCGDIVKIQVLNHHVPITDEVAATVQSVIDEVKKNSTNENNPHHLLFVRFDGKRKGRCPEGSAIQKSINRLARKQNIIDDQGNIFHFGNHAFRHTKGVELINNGMDLLHVQKWMAHASPEMTLRYAKILDTTIRKSWEEATKQGLFNLDETGRIKKIDIHDIENKDIIEWEYIRSNLDAVRMPLGYCMKPKKQECHTQLNPCLTCRNLCTTPDFIPQYELEIQETNTLIDHGKAQGRIVWVDKNQILLDRYKEILSVLKDGEIHHMAGKKSREYVGEERNDAR
jgi:integrase